MNQYPYDGMDACVGTLIYPAKSCPTHIPTFQVSAGFRAPEECKIPASLAVHRARHHPRAFEFHTFARVRAAAYALEHPETVVTGFGALALFGLPVMADGCGVVLAHARTVRRIEGDATTPTVARVRFREGEVWTLHYLGNPIQVAAPPVAVVQALKAIQKGEESWHTEPIAGEPVLVRAVQLVDAARRFLGVTCADIESAASQRLGKRWLKKVLKASSCLADSPKETEMRLIAVGIAKRFGLTLQEQVAVVKNGRIVTRFDLALLEVRIGLMYDGSHHWTSKQRNKDSLINLEVAIEDWTPLRFSDETLGRLVGLIEELLVKKGWVPSGRL